MSEPQPLWRDWIASIQANAREDMVSREDLREIVQEVIDSTRSDMRRWSKYPTLTDGEKRIQSALIRLETLLGEKGGKK